MDQEQQGFSEWQEMFEMNFGRGLAMAQVLESYPPALLKACIDPFDYQVGLNTGEKMRFEFAVPINKEWVFLSPCKDLPHPRGVYVSVKSIAWVQDNVRD